MTQHTQTAPLIRPAQKPAVHLHHLLFAFVVGMALAHPFVAHAGLLMLAGMLAMACNLLHLWWAQQLKSRF